MNEIPGNKPVAFRVPCCDSRNTPTPRFWAEIFNKTTEKGNFLQIDSSVFNIITNKDKELPKEITELEGGEERFRRYVPFANFVNTIEDYPYPYVIGGMCWEFPCVVPSDWSAQHVQQPNNPDTVRDWKLALDACVIKQGTFNLVFHPHGWIRNDQIVELIDHAVEKHGKKVKFLTFRECAERLNRNLLLNRGLRTAAGKFEGFRLVDVNQDGFEDIVNAHFPVPHIDVWCPDKNQWDNVKSAAGLAAPRIAPDEPPIMGTLSQLGPFTTFVSAERTIVAWMGSLRAIGIGSGGRLGIYDRLLDVDGDGNVELLRFDDVNLRKPGLIQRWTFGPNSWHSNDENLPAGNPLAMRFVDVNANGRLDLIYSDSRQYAVFLNEDSEGKIAWRQVFSRDRQDDDSGAPAIPPFVRSDGTNNGAWFHSGALWLMNEDTWKLPDNVFKLTFEEMLGKKEAGVRSQESSDTNPTRQRGDATPKPADRGWLGPSSDAAGASQVLGTKYSVPSTPATAKRSQRSVLRGATQFVAEQLAAAADGTRSVPATPKIDMPPPTSPEESLAEAPRPAGVQGRAGRCRAAGRRSGGV
jgi:hypothetical protein